MTGTGGPGPTDAVTSEPVAVDHSRVDVPPIAGLAALAALAATLTLALTHARVGYGVDSSVYLGVAHNLVSGRGPTVPMTFYTDHYPPTRAFGFDGAVPSTHFPPLFPAVLAAFEAIGMTANTAARTTVTALHAVNAVLIAVMLSRVLTIRRWSTAIAGTMLLFTIDTWLVAHSFAMSEPLLIALVLAWMLLMAAHLATGSRVTLGWVVALAVAAVLTRWAGASVGAASAVLLFGRSDWPWRVRLTRAAAVLGAVVMAGGAWSSFGRLAGGSDPRLLAVHAPGGFATSLLEVVTGWLAPTRWALIILAVGSVVGVALAAAPVPRRPGANPCDGRTERVWLLRTGAVFGATYLVVVYLSRTFLDVSIPTSGARGVLAAFEAPRIYVPLLPILLMALLASADAAIARIAPAATRVVGLTLPIACLAIAVLPPSHLTHAYDETSWLVAGTNRPPSPALRALRGLPAQTPIATNVPSTVYSQTGRSCVMVPERRVAVTGEVNPAYQREIAEMADLLVHGHGYLVVGVGGFGPPTTAGVVDFARWSRLVPIALAPDVSIYRVDAR